PYTVSLTNEGISHISRSQTSIKEENLGIEEGGELECHCYLLEIKKQQLQSKNLQEHLSC
ncbi:MAG: hypothetical protein Q8835_03310, partial [Sweet potato little leaf phytoplasma]|nr:hypothetical protein [Sweet potato little leaf phytoplasma]